MANRRLLHTVKLGADSVRIYRDRDWDCYVVRVRVLGGDSECEESSLEAARGTAAAQVRYVRRTQRTMRDAREHMRFLESTLIPDLHDSGTHATAEDFERCCMLMRALMEMK